MREEGREGRKVEGGEGRGGEGRKGGEGRGGREREGRGGEGGREGRGGEGRKGGRGERRGGEGRGRVIISYPKGVSLIDLGIPNHKQLIFFLFFRQATHHNFHKVLWEDTL